MMDTAVGFSVLVRGFSLALTVEGLRPNTRENYLRDVQRFGSSLNGKPIPSVTATDIRMFVTSLQPDHAAKTVREAQLALRRFFRFLLDEREIAEDPTRPVKLVKFRTSPQPAYGEHEVRRILNACASNTPDGVRDYAVLMVLYDTGVREGELVSMGLPDWNKTSVRVSGKTGVRDVPLGTGALRAMERYARRWRSTEAPLWRGKRGVLTESGVIQLVRRRCKTAGVEFKGVHAFRRAAAGQMKRLGMNDSDIMEVMGWKSVTMLRRYTATVAAELAHAAHRKASPSDHLLHA